MTGELLRKLKGRKYYTLPEGHPSPYERIYQLLGKYKILEGKRHENLEEAEDCFRKHGIDRSLEDFKTIVVLIRNPYTLCVSRFFYLKDVQKHNRTGYAVQLAQTGDFKRFILEAPEQCRIDDFLPIGKYAHLQNIKIIKYEEMSDVLNPAIASHITSPIGFDKQKNTSQKALVEDYIIDNEIENAIYEKYRTIFQRGYYKRIMV